LVALVVTRMVSRIVLFSGVRGVTCVGHGLWVLWVHACGSSERCRVTIIIVRWLSILYLLSRVWLVVISRSLTLMRLMWLMRLMILLNYSWFSLHTIRRAINVVLELTW